MRSLSTITLVSCLTVSAVFAQVPTTVQPNQDWRFAHPGATLVGGFRVKAVLDSPLVNTLIAEASVKDPSTGAMVGMAKGMLGGVSEVRFSVRDMGKGKNPDVLALVTGALDEAAAGALTQGKTGVRRINANTLLVGEGQSLEDALVRMNKPATGLQARALDHSRALAKHDLWFAGTLPEMPMTFPVLDSLRGIALGISMQSDLRVEVALEMASPKMAEDLVSSARRSQMKQPGLGAALQSEVEGSTARFRVEMPGDQLIQAVQQGLASGGAQSPLAALLGQSQVAFKSTAPEPEAPAKPKRETIRIYGLDEGTREIKPEPRQ
ncbi:MAG: hypothetical protein LAO55_10800 [Acidobacteriia bacterium]|nr:hypothetical protein [Terriglobia bacterium]